jgi:hypothetical protein
VPAHPAHAEIRLELQALVLVSKAGKTAPSVGASHESLPGRMLLDKPFPAYDGDGPYVFVCYAHADRKTVYSEMRWLRDRGINIWYDEGITPGAEFPEYLGNAILGASLVLFYVSPRSAGSRHCRDEVYFALLWGRCPTFS